MASSVATAKNQSLERAETKQPIGGLHFDWLMGILGFLFVGGLYLDGWAHAHGKVDNTFFTQVSLKCICNIFSPTVRSQYFDLAIHLQFE